ncbi:MAG: alpha/beta fold hydrolase, partial [Rhodanobacter sp.]
MTLQPETRSIEPRPSGTGAAPASAYATPFAAQRGTRRLRLDPKYGSGPRQVDVDYLWCGAPGAPTVIVQGGISADRDVTAAGHDDRPGWWQALVAHGAAVDLERWRVLSIDWLAPDRLGAGSVSSEDQADALAALLGELGIAQAHAFVGSSYGAMVGLAFAARYPRAVGRLLLLA